MEEVPDIYSVEFKDIYEIEFDDLQEASPIPMGQEISIRQSSDLEDEKLEPDMPAPILQASEGEKLKPREEIPEHILEVADKAIQELITTTAKRFIPLAQISDVAFGRRHGRDPEFGDFLAAIKQDPRLEYQGKQQYRIVREDDHVYWPDEQPDVDNHELTVLTDNVVFCMSEKPEWSMKQSQVLGIVRSLGIYLTNNEVNEFFALLATHPNITPHESGGHSFKRDSEFTPQTQNFEPIELPRDKNDDGRAMTTSQVSKALKKIRNSREFHLTRVEAKRIANPRQRSKTHKNKGGFKAYGSSGGSKRAKGRSHGKKVTLDSLINEASQS